MGSLNELALSLKQAKALIETLKSMSIMHVGNEKTLEIDQKISDEFAAHVRECKRIIENSPFKHSTYMPSIIAIVAENVIPQKFVWELHAEGQTISIVLVNYQPSFQEILNGKNLN